MKRYTILFYDGNKSCSVVVNVNNDDGIKQTLNKFKAYTEQFDFTVEYILEGTPNLYEFDENDNVSIVDNQDHSKYINFTEPINPQESEAT